MRRRFADLSPRARLWLALAFVGTFGAGAAVAGLDVRATYGAQVTADEPQYLLTAISIAEDRDLNISDELAAERHKPFHEAQLPQQTEPRADGSRISPHDPLLPALLAGPVAAGGWVAAKLALAGLAGILAALVLWAAVRRFGAPLTSATLATALFAASAPFAIYGTQVYPELPAAIVVTAAVIALTGPRRPLSIVLTSAAVVALPWFATKYLPVALVIAAIGVLLLWHRAQRREAVVFLGVLGLAAVAFLVLHQYWYGGWTPYASGDHFVGSEFTVIGFYPDYVGRARRLIGLLIGAKFGIAAWQPAWLLLAPALLALVGKRPQHWPVLVLPLLAGWLTAAFAALTMHGWWSPGRQVVVVLPIAVIAIAIWVGKSRLRQVTLAVLGAIGVFTYGWLVSEGLRGTKTWVVDFFETSNPIYLLWSAILPDYLEQPASMWPLHWFWSGLLIAAAIMSVYAKRRHLQWLVEKLGS